MPLVDSSVLIIIDKKRGYVNMCAVIKIILYDNGYNGTDYIGQCS